MKLKEGLSALAVAALLASPVAFGQQQAAQEQLESAKPGDQIDEKVGEGPTPGHTSLEPPKEQSADSGVTIQEDQQSASADQSSMSSEQQSASADMSSEQPSTSAGMSSDQQSAPADQASSAQQDQQGTAWGQAAADVPPPVDSETVRNIQQALSEQGQQVQTDGIWGEKTHQALMQFQRDNNLDATGQIDAQTMAALNLSEQQQEQQQAALEEDQQQSGSSQ